MSGDLIALVVVGVAFAAFVVGMNRETRKLGRHDARSLNRWD